MPSIWKESEQISRVSTKQITAVAISCKTSYLAVAYNDKIDIWSVGQGTLGSLPVYSHIVPSVVTALRWFPDHPTLVFLLMNGAVFTIALHEGDGADLTGYIHPENLGPATCNDGQRLQTLEFRNRGIPSVHRIMPAYNEDMDSGLIAVAINYCDRSEVILWRMHDLKTNPQKSRPHWANLIILLATFGVALAFYLSI
ncbi:hypothetical protein BDP27DRAFT_1429710 [Rhodocollybia butyracea]|uniref:Uncharacterized protein n=1 Tax=Rhodocollybia butyracea TaxID=206335 RepID=A0A9P5P8A3_9AGAR|nr:hypothetical protein BDP27DRAFT_1429710 [Rhodocollybia butyracea]